MDNSIKQVLRILFGVGIVLAVAVLVGAFFAFGGDNPLLIHMGNVIDIVLVMMTVLFLMAVAYKVYAMATGSGDPIVASQKRKNVERQKRTSSDDMPELTELIENLDATE